MADKALNVLLNAQETISKSLQKVSKSFGSTERAGSSLRRSLSQVTAATVPLNQSLNETGDDADSAGRGVSRASRSMLKAIPSALAFSKSLDEVADEATDAAASNTTLAAAVQAADLSFGNMTVNIGAIGVALRNLHTQIPILVTVLGTLMGTLFGVAGAAVTAGGAIAAILGGGALALGQQYADTMEDVESAMQGVSEVMSVVGSMFQEAMEPLMDQTSIDYFAEAMEGLANTFGRVINWVAEMRDEFMAFGRSIGSIFNQNLPDVLGSLENTFLELRPVLEDIMSFFMEELADGLDYFTNMILQVRDELGQFVNTLMDFAQAIHELGVVAIIEGMLPVFLGLLDMLTELINMLNSVDDAIISGIGKLIAFLATIKLISGALGAVFGPLSALGTALNTSFLAANTATAGISAFGTQLMSLASVFAPGAANAIDAVRGTIAALGGEASRAREGLSVFGDAWYSLRTSFTSADSYNPATNIAALGMASSGAADAADDLGSAFSSVSLGSFADEAVESARAAGGLRGTVVGLFDDLSQAAFNADGLGDLRNSLINLPSPDGRIYNIRDAIGSLGATAVESASSIHAMFQAGAAGEVLPVFNEATQRFQDAAGNFVSFDDIIHTGTAPNRLERLSYALGDMTTSAGEVAGSITSDLVPAMRAQASAIAMSIGSYTDLLTAKYTNITTTFRETLASQGLAAALVSTLIPSRLSDAAASFRQTYANQGIIAALRSASGAAISGAAGFYASASAKLSDAAASFSATAANAGYLSALRGMIPSLGTVTAALLAKASAAITAAGAVAAQAAATAIAVGPMGALAMAAGALNVALGGLPILIGAIVLGMGALVGIIGNAKGEFGGFSGIIESVKTVISGLVDLVLRAFIPVWNAMVSAFMVVWKPIDAVVSGVLSVLNALGLVSDETNDTVSLLKALFGLLGPLADAFGAIFKAIDLILRPIGTLLALPIQAFFGALATSINVVLFPFRALMSIIRGFLSLLWEAITVIPGVEGALTTLGGGIMKLLGMIINFRDTWASIWDFAVNKLISAVEMMLGPINALIGYLNRIPFVDIEKIDPQGLRDKVRKAREEEEENGLRVARDDFAKETEEENQENIASTPNPNISFEEHNQQNINGDMNMLPEEKERVKKLVEDAMDEANTFRRKRQGHSG